MPKTICIEPGCTKLVRARGLCAAHYERQRKAGNLAPKSSTKRPCSIEGCAALSDARSLCKAHYSRARRLGEFGLPECEVLGCTNPGVTRTLCHKHYQRAYKSGELAPQPVSKCSFPDCDKAHEGHGWCHGHLQQIQAGKEPRELRDITETVEERFWRQVDKTPSCWLWTGSKSVQGYGHIWVDGRVAIAPRWSYEHFVERIPDSMLIDHRCHTPACVNPEHLRIVTAKQNAEHRNGANVTSRTGVRGVRIEYPGVFLATVGHNSKAITVGRFNTLEEADRAVRAKRAELFTHDDAAY